MINFSPEARAEAVADRKHTVCRAQEAAIRHELSVREAKSAGPNDGVSLDALVAADAEIQLLRRKHAIAEGLVAGAEKALVEARAATAAAALNAKLDAENKRAAAIAKRLDPKLRAWLAQGLDMFGELEASRQQVAAINEQRGDRPGIADAEQRLRQIPERTLPAEYRDEEVWMDAEGRQPSQYRTVAGELVPDGHGDFRKVTRRVEVLGKRWLPATMPDRFAEAIRLVDLEGRVIWGNP